MPRGPKIKDVTGHKYGSLTAIKFAGRRNGRTYWTCRCECGYIGDYAAGNLQQGKSTRCKTCQYKHLSRVGGRKGVRLTYQGKTKSLSEWAEELGISLRMIRNRQFMGLSTNRILTPGYLVPIKGTQITFRGKTQNITQWAKELGITRQALWLRLNVYGWTKERALTLSATSKNWRKS